MKFSIGKFFAWILVGLLLVALLGFGITDVLVGRNNNTVAKVGMGTISSQDFARAFQQDLNFYRQQFQKEISIEEAKSLGIPQVTLGKLVNNKIIEERLIKIGLSRGDLAVSKNITNDKTFQDLSGTFSKNIYKSAVTRAGLELDEYENFMRSEMTSSFFLSLAKSSAENMSPIAELLAKSILESRSGIIYSLDLSETKNSYSISLEEQKKFYQKNLENFRVPDTSLISYSILDLKTNSKEIEISEIEIDKFYEKNISKISREAAYNVDRLIFKAEPDALDTLKNLTIGQISFESVGKERGLEIGDLNLGYLSLNQFDKPVRKQIVSTNEGDLIGPIKIGLGYAIYRVNNIQPAYQPTVEDIKDVIMTQLSYEKSYNQLEKIKEKANEEIAAGADFEDLKALGPFEQKELYYNSSTLLPSNLNNPEFIKLLSSLDSYPSDLLRLPNGSIVSARLEGTQEAHIPKFNEIKDKVFESIALERINERLNKTSKALQQDLKNLETPEFASLGIKEESFSNIDRSFSSAELTPKIVGQIFEIDKENEFYSDVSGGKLALTLLTNIAEFLPSEENASDIVSSIQEKLNSQISNDIRYYLINSLRDNIEIDVNSVAIENILSRFQ